MMTNYTTGLPQDWAYSPSIDLELKQYILMGYVQRVKARFTERKLYPYLSDVRTRAEELIRLQHSKESFARSLSTPFIGFDPTTGELLRARDPDPEPMRVIDDVIGFAVPNLLRLLDEGLELRDELARSVQLSPIGLLPLHISEGWLFLRCGREARVYAYSIPCVVDHDPEQGHRNVHTRFTTTCTMGIVNTFDRMKCELISRHPELPNPATFAVETDVQLPCIETLMPLAKRMVHAHVMARA